MKTQSLNPFEIRAELLPSLMHPHRGGSGLNPFEIRAELLLESRRKLNALFVLIPLKSGLSYYEESDWTTRVRQLNA